MEEVGSTWGAGTKSDPEVFGRTPLLDLTRGKVAQKDARAVLALGHHRRGHLNGHVLVEGRVWVARNQTDFRHGDKGLERVSGPCAEIIRGESRGTRMVVDIPYGPHLG